MSQEDRRGQQAPADKVAPVGWALPTPVMVSTPASGVVFVANHDLTLWRRTSDPKGDEPKRT